MRRRGAVATAVVAVAFGLIGCGGDDGGEDGGEPVTIETVRANLEDAGYRVTESNDNPIRFFSYLGAFEPQSTLEVRSPDLESIPQVYEFASEAEAASAVDRFAYDDQPAAQLGPVMISAPEADQEAVVEAAGGESPTPEPTDIEEIRTQLTEAGFEVTERDELPAGAAQEGVETMLDVSGSELSGETVVLGFDSEKSAVDAADLIADQDLYPALLGTNLVHSERNENIAAVVEALSG